MKRLLLEMYSLHTSWSESIDYLTCSVGVDQHNVSEYIQMVPREQGEAGGGAAGIF